jgi:hypothetical protein
VLGDVLDDSTDTDHRVGVGVGDRDGLVRQTGGQDVPDVATHLLCRADAIERS